jgi:hypothetical protein
MKYTNKETSEQLDEWGCDLISPLSWRIEQGQDDIIGEHDRPWVKEIGYLYPAYDLLWDVCVKYPKEFFGTEKCHFERDFKESVADRVVETIFGLAGEGRFKKANEYLLEHTIFNPKNQ